MYCCRTRGYFSYYLLRCIKTLFICWPKSGFLVKLLQLCELCLVFVFHFLVRQMLSKKNSFFIFAMRFVCILNANYCWCGHCLGWMDASIWCTFARVHSICGFSIKIVLVSVILMMNLMMCILFCYFYYSQYNSVCVRVFFVVVVICIQRTWCAVSSNWMYWLNDLHGVRPYCIINMMELARNQNWLFRKCGEKTEIELPHCNAKDRAHCPITDTR